MLLQYSDDLLFRIPALLHRRLPRSDYERTPVSTGRDSWGQVRGQVRLATPALFPHPVRETRKMAMINPRTGSPSQLNRV